MKICINFMTPNNERIIFTIVFCLVNLYFSLNYSSLGETGDFFYNLIFFGTLIVRRRILLNIDLHRSFHIDEDKY